MNHKWFTPVIMFETHVLAKYIEHVCSFILNVVFIEREGHACSISTYMYAVLIEHPVRRVHL